MDVSEYVLQTKKVIRDMEANISNASAIDYGKLHSHSIEMLRLWNPLVNWLDQVCNDPK